MVRDEQRLRRQFAALGRVMPSVAGIVDSLVDGRLRRVRLPLAFAFILGGFLWFLPVLGLWMLPLGLFLLALDIPALRPGVSAASIRLRRVGARWWRGRAARSGALAGQPLPSDAMVAADPGPAPREGYARRT